MKKDSLIKKYLISVTIALLLFSLFAGVVKANENSQKTVIGTKSKTINEAEVLSEISEFAEEYLLR